MTKPSVPATIGLGRLDLAGPLPGPIEHVEHLPHVLPDHGVDQRQRQAVEIDVGQRLNLAGLGFGEPAQDPLRGEGRHRHHEERDDQRHARGDR